MRIGVDTGGTFTDFVLWDGKSIRTKKIRSTPNDPSEAILDMSHVGLPVAPNNPRYGIDGSYLSCSHYYWESDEPSWFRCTDRSQSPADSEIRYGEITEANLDTHIVRRLTYNPDFYDLSDEILAFFDDPQ